MKHEKEALKKVQKVIGKFLQTQTCHATLALRLKLTPDGTVFDTATDGASFFFNPAWIMDASLEDITRNVAHAVTGCALKHHTRRGDRDPQKWNWASYMSRLPLVRDAGFDNAQGGLELSCEDAYIHAPDFPEPPPMPTSSVGDPDGQQGEQGSGSGQGQEGQQDDGSGDGQQDDQDDGSGDGSGEGSGDGQQDQQGQAGQPSPGNTGNIMDSPRPDGMSEPEYRKQLEQEERDWDMAVHTANQAAKAAGLESANLAETLAASHDKGPVDHKTLLRRYMHSSVKSDFSRKRPNRRYVHMDLFYPSLHEEAIDRVAFMIDSSSSMRTVALNRAYGDILEAVEEVRPKEVVLIWGDTTVQGVETFQYEELPETLYITGRGGTDYQPLFDALDDMEPVSCVLFYTDLEPYGGNFGEPPQAPLLWLVHERDYERHERRQKGDPPFGEVIVIPS